MAHSNQEVFTVIMHACYVSQPLGFPAHTSFSAKQPIHNHGQPWLHKHWQHWQATDTPSPTCTSSMSPSKSSPLVSGL